MASRILASFVANGTRIRRKWLEDVDGTLAADTGAAARQAYMDLYRKGLELAGAAQDPLALRPAAGDVLNRSDLAR